MTDPDHNLEPTEARQGRRGKPVLYVLIAGLALGLLYLGAMLLFPATEELPPEPGVVETEEIPEEQQEEPAGETDDPAFETPQEDGAQ